MEARIENEVEHLRNRLDVLEKLVTSLIKIEPIAEKDLTPKQRKLYKEVLSDIEKRDYSEVSFARGTQNKTHGKPLVILTLNQLLD